MTLSLFRDDAYLLECQASVTKINQQGGIILDQSVFYPTGGGQPGDSGCLINATSSINIATTIVDRDSGEIIHVPEPDQPTLNVGDRVTAQIDWPKRNLHMRMHTALHLLCAAVNCGVTGGQITQLKSRLDFDIGERSLDKECIQQQINQFVTQALPVTSYWISDEELAANPALVKTLSVQPPKGSGKVRLLKIGENIDLQPCGGTHVKNTQEIGQITVTKIENKGKRNRRVHITLA
ncbi:alanyl-tRNA editing protein [Aliikangiella sp. IMCC44632]